MKITRKIWSMVLCSCLILSLLCIVPVGAAEQTGEELVPEGQGAFDGLTSGKEGYLGNWQIEGGGSIVPCNPEDASSEDEYLKLVSTSDIQAKATLSRTFFEDKIAPKKTYLFSLAYYSKTANQAYIQMYEYAGSSSTGDSHKIDLPSTGGAWKETAFLFTTDASSAGTVNSISVSLNCHKYYVGTEETDTVLFDNISIREVNTAEYDVVSRVIAGSETADGYKANDAEGVVLQLLPLGWTSTDKAVVTGYVKAAQGESVTVSAGAAFAPDSAGETFTGTGEWIPFAFSGIAYNGNITVAATGNAEIKGITIQKDTNILEDTMFGDNWSKAYAGTHTISSDTDCPATGACLEMERTANEKKYLYYTNFVTYNAKDRYLFSIWYKSEITAFVSIEHRGYATDSPSVDLPPTNGKWKRMEFVFEMLESAPTSNTIYLQLGYQKNGKTEIGSVFFCAPSIEKLSNVKRNSLYAPCGTLMTVTGKDYSNAATHMQILGEPVQSAAGLNEVKAVYINGATPSTGNVVVAAYTKDANSTKQLVSVTVSGALPTSGVAYPTAMLDTSKLTAGTEIRTFVWDGISGLKALEKAVKITK